MALSDAAVGFNDALQNLYFKRLQEQKIAQAQQQQQFENSLKVRELLGHEAQTSALQQRQAGLDAEAATQKRASEANTLGEQLAPGAEMMPTDPAVGMLQQGGRGNLLTPRMTLSSTQTQGGATMPGGEQPMTGFLRTSARTEQKPEVYVKGATQKQSDTAADNARQAAAQAALAARETAQTTSEGQRNTETARHNRAMENKPATVGTIAIQTVDDQGNPVTRIVPKVAGTDFKKPPSATTANRLDSAAAVTQTGNDIIGALSDPKFIAVVGPAMGRYSKLGDFIGNPPPEFSHLAGQIESYALANMGVHGMRSAQGAQVISKLLDQKHTPESLIETIKGLNGFSQHFLENAGRSSGGTVAMVAPDGRALNVPADKVAELEAKGAKRR